MSVALENTDDVALAILAHQLDQVQGESVQCLVTRVGRVADGAARCVSEPLRAQGHQSSIHVTSAKTGHHAKRHGLDRESRQPVTCPHTLYELLGWSWLRHGGDQPGLRGRGIVPQSTMRRMWLCSFLF